VLDDAGEPVAITRGRCLGTIEHPELGSLWHFVAQYQVAGAPASSWELHTWLDALGRPRSAEFRTPLRVSKYSWRGKALELRRLGDLLIAEDSADVWIVPSHALYLRELMLRLGVGVDDAGAVHQRGLDPERDAVNELSMTLTDTELAGPSATLVLAGERTRNSRERHVGHSGSGTTPSSTCSACSTPTARFASATRFSRSQPAQRWTISRSVISWMAIDAPHAIAVYVPNHQTVERLAMVW